MGVTAIKSISNRAEIPYHVRNREHPGDTGGDGEYLAIYPGEDRSVNMWVPWCDTATDYAHDKNLLFEALGSSDQPDQAGESFSVWQSGEVTTSTARQKIDLIPAGWSAAMRPSTVTGASRSPARRSGSTDALCGPPGCRSGVARAYRNRREPAVDRRASSRCPAAYDAKFLEDRRGERSRPTRRRNR